MARTREETDVFGGQAKPGSGLPTGADDPRGGSWSIGQVLRDFGRSAASPAYLTSSNLQLEPPTGRDRLLSCSLPGGTSEIGTSAAQIEARAFILSDRRALAKSSLCSNFRE
jgi:hypothetical protein